MFGCSLLLRTGHSVASRTALFLTAAVLFLTLPQAADAQPESARKVAKSLQLQEARTLYTRGSEKVSEVSAGTWLIERNRMSRDDGGCRENRWVEVEYTEGLAQTVVTEGDLQVLYFCDSDLEGDPQEHIARPFYNFRALLGGTATIAEDGSALFREVKDKHRPLLKSLRGDLQSERVQPQVQVTVDGNTLTPDTLAVAEGGIRIPIGTELEQAPEERRPILEWSGNGVIETTDYAQIPGRVKATPQMDTEPGSESSGGTFPWWALALIGILATLAGALGLFLHWKRQDLHRERREKEKLQSKIERSKKKKKSRVEMLRNLSSIVEDIHRRRDENMRKNTSRVGSPKSSAKHIEEVSLIKEIEEKISNLKRNIKNLHDLKEELLDQLERTQEEQKEELQSLLRTGIAEVADQRASPEDIESLREELLETAVHGVGPEDIEELSHKIEALFSHLQERDASDEGRTEDKHLQLPIDELQEKSPTSPLPLKPGKEEPSGTEGRVEQDESPSPLTKSLLRSVDRLELLNRVKEDIGSAEQEEQKEASEPDPQTDAGTSVAEEKSPGEEVEEPDEEEAPVGVDPDFTSVRNRCHKLAQEYALGNQTKRSIIKK